MNSNRINAVMMDVKQSIPTKMHLQKSNPTDNTPSPSMRQYGGHYAQITCKNNNLQFVIFRIILGSSPTNLDVYFWTIKCTVSGVNLPLTLPYKTKKKVVIEILRREN